MAEWCGGRDYEVIVKIAVKAPADELEWLARQARLAVRMIPVAFGAGFGLWLFLGTVVFSPGSSDSMSRAVFDFWFTLLWLLPAAAAAVAVTRTLRARRRGVDVRPFATSLAVLATLAVAAAALPLVAGELNSVAGWAVAAVLVAVGVVFRQPKWLE